MTEPKKPATPADRQVQRLESLRKRKEEPSAPRSAPRVEGAAYEALERALRELEAKRENPGKGGASVLPSVPPPLEKAVVRRPSPGEGPLASSLPAPPSFEPPVPRLAIPMDRPEPKETPVSKPPVTPRVSPSAPETLKVTAPPPPPRMQAPSPTPPLVVTAPPPPPIPLAIEAPPEVDDPLPPGPPEGEVAPTLSEDVPSAGIPPAWTASAPGAFQRFDGRLKNIKLSVAQMKVLEQLFDIDPRLYPARVLRLSLNQWLAMENLPEDQPFEPLGRDALLRIRRDL